MKIKMLTTSAGPEGCKMAGSIYDENEVKAKELVNGFYAVYVDESEKVIKRTEDKTDNLELNYLGGGYYELPNGEKVKGKAAALEALKALEDIKALEALKALEGGEVNGTEVNNGTNNGTGDNTGADN